MTERWQRELRKLRAVEPSADDWKRAETRAPSGDGFPPPRQRLAAALVAVTVFAAAGLFLVRSFERGSEGGLRASNRVDGSRMIVTATSARGDEDAFGSITLTVDGASVPGVGGSAGTWPVGDGGDHPIAYPLKHLNRSDFVKVIPEATMEVAGDADTLEMVAHVGVDPEGAETMSIDRLTFSTLVPGYYVLRVEATWVTPSTETWSSKLFPIEIVEAPAETPSTYVFTDVEAGPSTAEPGDLAVTFTVAWSGAVSPGVQMCTYRALAADDSVIGQWVHLAAWQPGRWYRDVPGDPEAAVRGEVSCDGERLDDPGIADVTTIPRPEGSTLDDVMTEREDRLEAWAAHWSVDSMFETELAGNMWAINEAMTQGHDEDLTVTWQLADRRHYLCVRLPPEHEFRGGEFCD